ncbi:MAG TPA: hypothetical protein PKG95_07730 [Anaerolineaceae bacterium]|jgi:hypothetical protein|nr:hypothetical protein [Anaerolineaceae bacterium]
MKLKKWQFVLSFVLLAGLLVSAVGSALANVSAPATAPELIRPDNTLMAPHAFHYLYVTGSALRPRDGAYNWLSTGSGGCIYTTVGGLFNVDLQLPEGAGIDYLRIFYYDTSASDANAWITSYDGEGNFDDLVYVGSTGTAGYGTALSDFTRVYVHNANQSLVLNWRPNDASSAMQLCGLRIAYHMPDYYLYLPGILR